MSDTQALRGATQEAIQDHYDLANDFYRLWLGETMMYSGALWNDEDTLPSAQIRKIDHHIRESRAEDRTRVLDIGCGWGGVLRRLVENAGVSQAVGLTLSEAQAEWIRGMNLPNTEVRVEDWQEHKTEKPYESIISIGAFEHFARLDFTEEQKVDCYKRFFQKCHELLASGGYLSLQTFAYGSARPRLEAVNAEATQFLAQEIFRETDPPRLANIAEAVEGTFEVVSLSNDRMGYARTLRTWLKNLKENRAKAVEIVGEEKVNTYIRYLQYSFIGFFTGNLDLYRITLRRIDSRGTATN